MKIVAITACASGVAHTYMAATAIKKCCKKNGIEVKVETQGANGIDDELTPADIAEADVVIDCCDVALKKAERFDGKLMVKGTTSEATAKPVAVVSRALKAVKESRNA